MSKTFPGILYRAYQKIEHAEKFVTDGAFRLGKLQIYRDLEDRSRTDRTEGRGHYLDRDGIHENFELGGDIYLLSLSTDEVDLAYLKGKMGRNIVKISDPEVLIKDIENYLVSNGYVTFGGVKGDYIQYTKGGTIEKELNESDRAKLSVIQKPDMFLSECEYRLYTILNSQRSALPPNGYLDINLGKSLDYAEVIRKGI